MSLRVCLFEGEIRWMKNFREKMGRKTFLTVFGWVGRKENKWWGPGVFSPGPPKIFLSKSFLDKSAHVQLHIGFIHIAFLHTFFFFPDLLVGLSSIFFFFCFLLCIIYFLDVIFFMDAIFIF